MNNLTNKKMANYFDEIKQKQLDSVNKLHALVKESKVRYQDDDITRNLQAAVDAALENKQ
ncbi:hypothetical protein ACPV5R_18670 [Vibrio astriarenae]